MIQKAYVQGISTRSVDQLVRALGMNHEAARPHWRHVADGLRERFEHLAKAMDSAEDDVLAYITFHPDHWTKISSTNPPECLIGEVKRRTDVVGIFPNDAAIMSRCRALRPCIPTEEY